MREIQWETECEGVECYIAKLPWKDQELEGVFILRIQPRPHYCDRGDWTLFLDELYTNVHQLDGADGFPRFFFGSLDEAKEQFNRWVAKRRVLQ